MKERLFIIGNGFDLHHGLRCSFSDFRTWLECNSVDTYIMMRKLYENIDSIEWWSHFEESIGYFNNVFPPHSSEIRNLYTKLDKAFVSWVHELETMDVSKDASLYVDIESKYLNFNYTNTLETLYGIDTNRILHIHGNVKQNDSLIYGGNISHGWYYVIQENVIGDILGGDIFEVDNIVCSHNKNVQDNITKHVDFFSSIHDIKEIIVYGFSFAQIDMPYIEHIAHSTTNVNWSIYVHSKNDKERVSQVIQGLNENDCVFDVVEW